MKRLLHDNVGPGGSLDNDRLLRAILAHRNTPDQLSKKSPAEILFGHQLRDALPTFKGTQAIFENEKVFLTVARGVVIEGESAKDLCN